MHIRLYPAHGQNMPKPSARCLDFPSLQTEKTQLSGLCLRQGATDRLSVSQSNLWGLSWHWRHAFADADAVTNAADDAEEGDKDEIRMKAMVAVLAVAWHQTRWKKKSDAAAGPEHDCHADDGVLAILHKRSPLRVLWSFQTPFCPKYEYSTNVRMHVRIKGSGSTRSGLRLELETEPKAHKSPTPPSIPLPCDAFEKTLPNSNLSQDAWAEFRSLQAPESCHRSPGLTLGNSWVDFQNSLS